MGPTSRFVARSALVVSSAAVVQVGVISPLAPGGTRPIALLLVAVAAGVALAPDRAAAVGFAAGLVFDLLLTTPLGLGAGVFAVTASLVARLPAGRSAPWWRIPAVGAGASAGAYGTLLVMGSVLTRRPVLPERPVLAVVVVAVVNGVGAPLVVRVLRWAGAAGEAAPVVGAGRGP